MTRTTGCKATATSSGYCNVNKPLCFIGLLRVRASPDGASPLGAGFILTITTTTAMHRCPCLPSPSSRLPLRASLISQSLLSPATLQESAIKRRSRRYLHPLEHHRRLPFNHFIHLPSCLVLVKISPGRRGTRKQEKLL